MKLNKCLQAPALSITLTILTLLTGTQMPVAAVLKNVSEYEGERCNTPPKGSGIIVGYFSGSQFGASVSQESYHQVSRYRCFKNLEICKGWLYTMNSLYSDAGPPTISRCFIR